LSVVIQACSILQNPLNYTIDTVLNEIVQVLVQTEKSSKLWGAMSYFQQEFPPNVRRILICRDEVRSAPLNIFLVNRNDKRFLRTLEMSIVV